MIGNRPTLPFDSHHAVIIGINEYCHIPQLRTAVNDATALKDLLCEPHGFNTDRFLLNASGADIHQLLAELPRTVGENDRLVFYFAGHGIVEDGADGNPDGYLLPVDASPSERRSWISMKSVYRCFEQVNCRHLLCILDCCFAGSFRWSSRHRHLVNQQPKSIFRERFEQYVQDRAWQVLTSSAHDQCTYDLFPGTILGARDDKGKVEVGNSPFVETLLRGLQGEADPYRNGLVIAAQLYAYVREQVERRSLEHDESKRQTPLFFPLERHDKGEFVFVLPTYRPLPTKRNRNPYRSYIPYQTIDDDLFFGRRQTVNEIMFRLEQHAIVMITGGSGVGKSSFVQAGLAPELRRLGYRVLPVIQPETGPENDPSTATDTALDSLSLACADLSATQDISETGRRPRAEATALIIDQAESLVANDVAEEKRDRFCSLLQRLIDTGRQGDLKIIVAVRSGYEQPVERLLGRHEASIDKYRLPAMKFDELREVAFAPAEQELLHIESETMLDADISSVADAPALLPHFSALLSKLYERNSADCSLRLSDYQLLEGVIGLLHQSADCVYKAMDDEEKKTMQWLLLRMVAVSQDEKETTRRVCWDELDCDPRERSRLVAVVNRLVAARIITIDAEESGPVFLAPAHARLLSWQLLETWIREQRSSILLMNNLCPAARSFEKDGSKKHLWSSRRQIKELAEELRSPSGLLNQREISFVRKSREHWKRRLLTAVVSVLLLVLVATGFSLRERTIKRASELATEAQQLRESDPVTAMSSAYKAASLHESESIDQVLCEVAAVAFERPFPSAVMAHELPVNEALFSPDDRSILTISNDKTAALWDLRGHRLATMPHEGKVYAASFSPDGQRILTVSRDSTAMLWALNGQLLLELPHDNLVSTAVFSSDGKQILTASQDNTARLWGLQGEALEVISHPSDVSFAGFLGSRGELVTIDIASTMRFIDRDGLITNTRKNILGFSASSEKQIYFTISLHNKIEIWSFDGEKLGEINDKELVVKQAVLSPDGAGVFAGYPDGTVKRWSFGGQVTAELPGNGRALTSISCSADGRLALTASEDGTAKIWDVTTGELRATLLGHEDWLSSAAFSSDERMVVTASRDGTARLWKLDEQPARIVHPTTHIKEAGAKITTAAVSPSGGKVLVAAGEIAEIFDLENGSLSQLLAGHERMITSACFSPDGRLILTASADTTVKLWESTGKLLVSLEGHADNISSAVFAPDGRLLLTASYDTTAKLWDLGGRMITSYDGHKAAVNQAVFSPDGERILTAAHDRTAKLWDLDGNLLTDFTYHSSAVTGVAFSPHGRSVLTLSVVPRLWDLDGNLLTEFETPRDSSGKLGDIGYSYAGFTSDDSRVVAIRNDNTVYIWSLAGDLQGELSGHTGKINTVRISPGGDHAVTASADHSVGYWDLDTWSLIRLKGHIGQVVSAEMLRNGGKVLSISEDKTIRIWSTPEDITRWFGEILSTDHNPEEYE